MLERANGWRQEGQAEIAAEEFKRRLSIRGITAYPTSSIQFEYGADDMFTDYAVNVTMDYDTGDFTDAGL
eukprot:6031043-Prymnesium_polylepis.1